MISVVIPNRNGAATIGRCLEAALDSSCPEFEIVVVDDCSDDNSVEIISRYSCRLIKLDEPSGASAARNAGAAASRGELLFFCDADCLLKHDTLEIARQAREELGPSVIIGGTYTPTPWDRTFFSTFQSIFIHYFETRGGDDPDYVATHAMAIDAELFRKSGGFPEHFLPILEDVEFSHRMRRAGCRLVIREEILVSHIFNFSLLGSLKNAVRKSSYWTFYSAKNQDLLTDSGTASLGLKVNVLCCALSLLFAVLFAITRQPWPALIPGAVGANVIVNFGLLRAFFVHQGFLFGLAASLYYLTAYPLAVGTGAAAGLFMIVSGQTAWEKT